MAKFNSKKLLLIGLTGEKGATGAKVVSIDPQGQDENGGNIYLITFDDGTTATFTAPKGEPGEKGADGTMSFADLTEEQKASLKGEPGPQGEQGEQGPQGEKGEKGEQGIQGEKGDKGNDGKTPFIGGNGNWWIGDIDTGIKASGSGGGGTTVIVNGEAVKTFDADTCVKNTDIDKTYGVTRESNSNKLTLTPINNNEMNLRNSWAFSKYRAVLLSNFDHLLKLGLIDNAETLTEEEKAAAQNWLGVGLYQHTITLVTSYEGKPSEQITLYVTLPSSEELTLVNFYQRLSGMSLFGEYDTFVGSDYAPVSVCIATVSNNNIRVVYSQGEYYMDRWIIDITENTEIDTWTITDIVTKVGE